MTSESSDGERKVVESVGASVGLHGGDGDLVGGAWDCGMGWGSGRVGWADGIVRCYFG